jgi:hypothetical protein
MCSRTIMKVTLEFTKGKFSVNNYHLFCKHYMTFKFELSEPLKFELLTAYYNSLVMNMMLCFISWLMLSVTVC